MRLRPYKPSIHQPDLVQPFQLLQANRQQLPTLRLRNRPLRRRRQEPIAIPTKRHATYTRHHPKEKSKKTTQPSHHTPATHYAKRETRTLLRYTLRNIHPKVKTPLRKQTTQKNPTTHARITQTANTQISRIRFNRSTFQPHPTVPSVHPSSTQKTPPRLTAISTQNTMHSRSRCKLHPPYRIVPSRVFPVPAN
jgi:hypothetical protein